MARISDEQYRRILGVNLDGVVFGVRRMAQVMDARLDRRHRVARGSHRDRAGPALRADEACRRRLRPLGRSEARGARDPAEHGQPGVRRHAAARRRGPRRRSTAAGFPLLQPEDVAAAVLRAADDDEVGQAWIVQPGREPLKFRFPNLPGPRVPGKEGMRPPL